MTLKYIILGVIQGITEPIPVSSSGHLLVFRNLFNAPIFQDLNFEIITNFGSFLAILFIFRKDIIRLLKNFFNYIFNKNDVEKKKSLPDFNYCLKIIIATIPIGIVGFLLKDKLEKVLSSLTIVGISFLITAVFLLLATKIKGNKNDKDITFKDAIIIGLIQIIAIIPGISRSGSTLVGCLFRDMKRETALRFSFMLYFPVSIATFILSIIDIIKDNNFSNLILPYTLGMIAACIVTYFTTNWLFKEVKNGKLWKFAIYCILIGLFTLFVL